MDKNNATIFEPYPEVLRLSPKDHSTKLSEFYGHVETICGPGAKLYTKT